MLKKIAILSNAYPPHHIGGAARIAALQVEILSKAGYEVRIWSPSIDWFSASPFTRLFFHLKDLGAREDLVNDIVVWKPDLLITHTLTGCGFGTPTAVQLTGVRWVHILHDIQLFEPSGQLTRLRPVTFWQIFWATLRLFAFKHPHLVISPTHWLLDQHRTRFLLKYHETPAEVLPNPAPSLSPVSRAKVHEPEIRLLFVGQLSRAKGSELLRQLVKTLRIPFVLHVVGDGPERERLARTSSRIVFHGMCEQTEEVLKHMREADVLLVPSRIHENQPTVILEAASVQLPVIAAHRGGIAETLGPAAANMMCSPTQVESWCNAIERLLDPQIYQHQVNLMLHVAQAHDPEVYAQRFVELVTSKR